MKKYRLYWNNAFVDFYTLEECLDYIRANLPSLEKGETIMVSNDDTRE